MSEYCWVCPFDFVRVIVSQLFQRYLNSEGPAGGNRTMLISVSLQIAMLWLSVISLVFCPVPLAGLWGYCTACRLF